MRVARPLAAILFVALLSACAVSPDPDSLTFDPFEDDNRQVHRMQVEADKAVYGPVSRAWGETIPQPIRTGITNLRYHWKLPGQTIQYGLQANGDGVMRNAFRFGVNTTFGLLGVLDPAKEMGLEYRKTNFDETFNIWGIPEGGYVELPLGGPGTQRDWTGWVLDIVFDPMLYIAPAITADTLVVIASLDIVNDRYVLDPVLEELLHTSEDSYTAQRITYLQNMRARLQGEAELDDLEDIYADF